MRLVASVLRAAACALLLSGAPHDAAAELRALLVGVSGYPPPDKRLQGPPTAVQRLRELLLRRGATADRITVLADGVPGAGRPTRAALLAALDDLARDAQAGDVVVVHFAGHGSLQPDPVRPGTLLPTLLLLPLDIGPWNGAVQPAERAVTRDELRAAIDRISARGAFVWAVFDACHSAGVVRGGASAANPQGRPTAAADAASAEVAAAKTLLASWLAGLDAEAASADLGQHAGVRRSGQAAPPAAAGRVPLPSAAATGRAAYFYAAQASEYTGEVELDAGPGPGGAQPARRHGLFSHVLIQLLDEARGAISYRQLADALLARYRTLPSERLTPTPVFSGNGLDTRVLGQDSVPLQQWPLLANPRAAAPTASAAPAAPWWVAVGRVHGIALGARFAVVPDALSRDDQAITQLEAVQVMDDHSLLAPPPAPAASAAAPGAAPRRAVALQAEVNQLRLLANGLAYTLRVAFDARGCAPPCALGEAMQLLRTAGVAGVDLRWVDAADDGGARPNLWIRADRGRVLLLESKGPAGPPDRGADGVADAVGADAQVLDLLASAAPNALARRLAQRLHGHARLRNLSQLAARSALDPLQAVLESSVRRRGAQAPHGVGALALRHGDQVVLTMRNRGADPIDVTVLYLDADGSIVKIHPTELGEVNRLEAGEPREVVVNIGPPAVGPERLWAIAAVKRSREPTVDFGFLEQPALARRRQGGAEADEIGEYLAGFADAAFAAHLTRSDAPRSPRPPSSRTLIRSHELDVGR